MSRKFYGQNKLITLKLLSPSDCRKPPIPFSSDAEEEEILLPWDTHTSFAPLSVRVTLTHQRVWLSPCHSFPLWKRLNEWQLQERTHVLWPCETE